MRWAPVCILWQLCTVNLKLRAPLCLREHDILTCWCCPGVLWVRLCVRVSCAVWGAVLSPLAAGLRVNVSL